MKRQLLALSRRYQAALQNHLQQAPRSRVQPAQRLGQQAVTLGLETLDLARIHKTALNEMVPSGGSPAARDRLVKRAGIFFTEAVIPIEKTHRAGVESAARVKQQTKRLKQRTAQLAAANRELRKRVIRRKAAEGALKTRERLHAKLLQESRRLQEHWRRLTRGTLSAQEDQRKKISRELRDEIAQTLLGINVRLLTLKKGAGIGTGGLAKEIASTQELLRKSVRTINRFAQKFGVPG